MSTATPSASGFLPSSSSNNNGTTTNPIKRPTTPLRRISASSLRSLSLSHSRSRPQTTSELPLQHLSLLFEELSDAFADLAGTFEGLNEVNEGLDGFNEAFGGYLYGLRVNCYTADFDQVNPPPPLSVVVDITDGHMIEQAPTRFNFEQVSKRPPPPEPTFPTQTQQSYASSDSEDGAQPHGRSGNDTTFHTHDSDYSFVAPPVQKGSGRGRGSVRGRGRGGAPVGMTRKAKDEMMVRFSFKHPVFHSLTFFVTAIRG